MRVEEGYRPKVKFSVSFFPDTFDRLCAHCKKHGMHRANFIEAAVRAMLEDGSTFRPKQPVSIRASMDFTAKPRKKQNVQMLVSKPKARAS